MFFFIKKIKNPQFNLRMQGLPNTSRYKCKTGWIDFFVFEKQHRGEN